MAARACLNFNRTWAEVGAIVTSRDKSGKPNGWVRDAFKDGVADKVLIPAGTQLYKFNNSQLLVDMAWLRKELGITLEGAVTISPWWSPYDGLTHAWSAESGRKGSVTDDPGWIAKKAMAARFGVSVREWGRITSAVKENWNSLEHLMVVRLKVDAYGWFGGFTAMARMDVGATSKRLAGEGALGDAKGRSYSSQGMKDRIAKIGTKGSLAGGGTQLYIPNIRMINVASFRTEDLSKL